MQYQNFIQEILAQSSKIANKNFGKLEHTLKSDNSVLTETDLEIGRFILEEIKKAFPSYNIIDEESGIINNKSEFTFVVDPIDGTSNFAEGIPLYGTMIGLLKNDTPIIGGIALPFFKETVIAEKDKGAFCNGIKLHVTKEKDLKHTLIAYGFKESKEQKLPKERIIISKLIENVRSIRSSNSVYDTVLVAKGRYAATLCHTSRIWDNVAQQIVIEEAGGLYTDFFGNPINYSYPLMKTRINYTYCASTQLFHKELQKIIHGKN